MSTFNITTRVLDLIKKGGLSHKQIATQICLEFKGAKTTHKSVASLKKDFKKKGWLDLNNNKIEPTLESNNNNKIDPKNEEQIEMFSIFEQSEYQLTLI